MPCARADEVNKSLHRAGQHKMLAFRRSRVTARDRGLFASALVCVVSIQMQRQIYLALDFDFSMVFKQRFTQQPTKSRQLAGYG